MGENRKMSLGGPLLKGRSLFKGRGAAGLWAGLLFTAALGFWHGIDVKDGIAQTGRGWLLGWYGLAVFWGLLSLLFLGVMVLGRERWRPERFFAAASLSLGLLFMGVLPPLSAPDEVSHYISAYQVSNRLLGRPAADGEGRVYIRAEDAWVEDMEAALDDKGGGLLSEEPAKILGQTLDQDAYAVFHDGGRGGGGEGLAVSYQPAVRTTPLAYAPQALGLALGQLLGLGSIGLLFMGRAFNLAFYTLMGWLAIRRTPFGKEVFAGAGLLPMSLHLAASMSYDVMILAMSGYFLAVCLDLAYQAKRVRAADILVLALALAVMGPCKMVYGVIAGFCLLIPVKKFGGWGRWAAGAACVLGAFGAAMFLVNRQTVALYTGITDRYVAWAQEPGYSFAQLIHSPLKVLRLCYNTLALQGEQLFGGMIGERLGNMDPVLNIPFPVVLALGACLAVLALKKPGEALYLSLGQRVWIWFLCACCLGALMFSMLLAWTPVSAVMVQGVQGRYLLPLLPAMLLTMKNSRVVRTGGGDWWILFGMACMDVYGIWRIFGIVCMRV